MLKGVQNHLNSSFLLLDRVALTHKMRRKFCRFLLVCQGERITTSGYIARHAKNFWRLKRGGIGELPEETSVESNYFKIWKKLWKLGIKENWNIFGGSALMEFCQWTIRFTTGQEEVIQFARDVGNKQVETIEHMLLPNCKRAKNGWKMPPVQ